MPVETELVAKVGQVAPPTFHNYGIGDPNSQADRKRFGDRLLDWCQARPPGYGLRFEARSAFAIGQAVEGAALEHLNTHVRWSTPIEWFQGQEREYAQRFVWYILASLADNSQNFGRVLSRGMHVACFYDKQSLSLFFSEARW